MHVLYYITSHGYGHAVRSAAVCNALAALYPGIRISIRSNIAAGFFEEELSVAHEARMGVFDVGCLQSDGVTVLIGETLRVYSEIAARNKLQLDSEARWCKDNRVDCVISDITPFAFEVAEKAGIPSVAISNFTWHDVYSPYVQRFPRYKEMLAAMGTQYGKAALALALYPALPMPVFKNKKPIAAVVCRKGADKRDDIRRTFGINPDKLIGLIYTGNFGLGSVRWKRLEKLDGWEFVGVHQLHGNPKNYHLVTKDKFRYEDLAASADVIIGKMGYGVFSESLLHGIPLMYLPRKDFSEFPVLDAEARRLGNGIRIDSADFADVVWGDLLEEAVKNNKIKPSPDNGAQTCAEEIIKIAS
jgi:L-arabinokinase